MQPCSNWLGKGLASQSSAAAYLELELTGGRGGMVYKCFSYPWISYFFLFNISVYSLGLTCNHLRQPLSARINAFPSFWA